MAIIFKSVWLVLVCRIFQSLPVVLGRTAMWSVLSAAFGENAWIIASCSMNVI